MACGPSRKKAGKAQEASAPREGSKTAQVIALLQRPSTTPALDTSEVRQPNCFCGRRMTWEAIPNCGRNGQAANSTPPK